jgi:hypothetical protein
MSRWPETFLAFFVTGRKRPPISLSEIRVLWALDGYRLVWPQSIAFGHAPGPSYYAAATVASRL